MDEYNIKDIKTEILSDRDTEGISKICRRYVDNTVPKDIELLGPDIIVVLFIIALLVNALVSDKEISFYMIGFFAVFTVGIIYVFVQTYARHKAHCEIVHRWMNNTVRDKIVRPAIITDVTCEPEGIYASMTDLYGKPVTEKVGVSGFDIRIDSVVYLIDTPDGSYLVYTG